MTVENSHIGKMLVSPHAQERWRERSSGRLTESLQRAVPFGGQYGDNLLLIDGDIVFACEKYGRAYLVKTVLTRDQALANMEFAAGGHQMYNKLEVPKKKPMEVKPTYNGGVVALAIPKQEVLFERHAPEQKKTKRNPSYDEQLTIIKVLKITKMTDNQLADAKDSHSGKWHDFIDHEQRRRKNIKTRIDQLKSDVMTRKVLRMAILEMVEPDIAEKIFKRAKEISDTGKESINVDDKP
jgi:hypothetical protein